MMFCFCVLVARTHSLQHTHPTSSVPASSRFLHGLISLRPDTSRSLLLMILIGTTFVPVRREHIHHLISTILIKSIHIFHASSSSMTTTTMTINLTKRMSRPNSRRRPTHLPAEKRRDRCAREAARRAQPAGQPALAPRRRVDERAAQDLPVAREDRRAREVRQRRAQDLAGRPARPRPHRDRGRRGPGRGGGR